MCKQLGPGEALLCKEGVLCAAGCQVWALGLTCLPHYPFSFTNDNFCCFLRLPGPLQPFLSSSCPAARPFIGEPGLAVFPSPLGARPPAAAAHPLLGAACLEGQPQLLAPRRVLPLRLQAAPEVVPRPPARLPLLHAGRRHLPSRLTRGARHRASPLTAAGTPGTARHGLALPSSARFGSVWPGPARLGPAGPGPQQPCRRSGAGAGPAQAAGGAKAGRAAAIPPPPGAGRQHCRAACGSHRITK